MPTAYKPDDECVVVADMLITKTARALYCQIGSTEVWLPLSQIDCDPCVEPGDENVRISLPFWMAESKEIDEYIEEPCL